MEEGKSIFSWLSVPERTRKPRTAGLNMVVPVQVAIEGMNMLQDLVSWGGDYIDYYKMGTEMKLQRRDAVVKKLVFLKQNGD
jgi:phosphosulfolactate synthase (CoM biosynthesis protein A)